RSKPIDWQAEVIRRHMEDKFGFTSVEVAGTRGREPTPVEQHQAVETMLNWTRAFQDGMATMALPVSAISRYGKLSLVLDPRGSKREFGSYQVSPTTPGVIHITGGANSFGHEWV